MHLLALPDEVLDHILFFVRLFEQGPLNRQSYHPNLYHVILTCQRLKNLAIPRMYEVVNTRYRVVKLIKSLALHPANASLVRQLDCMMVDRSDDKVGQFTPDDASLFNRILENHGIAEDLSSADAAGNLGTGLCSFPTETIDWATLDYGRQVDLASLFASVIIVLVRNATVITYCSDLDSPIAFPPNSLPQLRCLSTYHWNIIDGYDLSIIDNLLKAAPNVDHLHATLVDEVTSLSRNEHITKLSLPSSYITKESWDVIFAAFPNLESLIYEDNGVDDCVESNYDDETGFLYNLLPRELYNVFEQHRPKLKHLSLEHFALDRSYGDYTDEEFVENHLMKSLAFMDSLETLQISANYLYRSSYDIYGGSQTHVHQAPSVLVGFLPASIRKLVITNLAEVAKDDLLELINVAPERFPNLEAIDLATTAPSIIDILENRPPTGIKLRIINYSFELSADRMYNCPHWLQPLEGTNSSPIFA